MGADNRVPSLVRQAADVGPRIDGLEAKFPTTDLLGYFRLRNSSSAYGLADGECVEREGLVRKATHAKGTFSQTTGPGIAEIRALSAFITETRSFRLERKSGLNRTR